MRKPGPERGQQGAALLLFAAILVLGVTWLAITSLGKAAPAAAQREIRTGQSLQAAKQALLAYVAQYAARTDHAYPGRFPCPESANLTNEGVAAGSCSNTNAVTGRLPWRTLGIDPLRDGDGELLWYVLSPGFRGTGTPPIPAINFGTAPQLPYVYNGSATNVVALIIAPGRALNTLQDTGTPGAGCTKVNQQIDRYATPLNPAKFFECGNVDGNPYANPGSSQWSNDRVIAITQAEWIDAISAAVADRLQRTVVPVLADWDQIELAERGRSWGAASPNGHGRLYLPFASAFTDPSTNDLCGNAGSTPTRDGLPPAASSSGSCSSNWTGTVPSFLLQGLVSNGCTQTGTHLRCEFTPVVGATSYFARITATAQRVAGSFRGTILVADVQVSGTGGSAIFGSVPSISASSGAATVNVDVSWPLTGIVLTAEVLIPNLRDAVFMAEPPAVPAPASYTATKWFRDNNWARYTYYAVAPASTVNVSPTCGAGGTCLTVNGLAAHTTNTRLLLALMGRPLASQTQPSGDPAQYLESRTSATVFNAATVTSTYNDRLAVCPFQHTASTGTVSVCN